jgi:hypothetical protein
MQVNKNENIFPVDVDDTLIIWDPEYDCPVEERVECIDPYTGEMHLLKPHWPHIRLLKEKKERGAYVRVHTQGGYQWGEAVVKALGLEAYVDAVETKASTYMDDLPSSAWMTERIYIKPDSNWKGAK